METALKLFDDLDVRLLHLLPFAIEPLLHVGLQLNPHSTKQWTTRNEDELAIRKSLSISRQEMNTRMSGKRSHVTKSLVFQLRQTWSDFWRLALSSALCCDDCSLSFAVQSAVMFDNS